MLPRTSISSSSVSEAESSDVSHARMNCSFCGGDGRRDGTVRCVCEDAAEFALPARELGCEFEKEAEAAAEANDDPAVGATGSSTTVVRKLSHWSWSSKGLTLRLRSPRPSTVVAAGLQDSRRELEGSGPSAMVRRPILRSGGKATALLSLLAWPSSGASACSPLMPDRSARGLRERASRRKEVEASPRYGVLSLMRDKSASASTRDAAAGANPGVKAGRGRSWSNTARVS
jgi:hypothetical protein